MSDKTFTTTFKTEYVDSGAEKVRRNIMDLNVAHEMTSKALRESINNTGLLNKATAKNIDITKSDAETMTALSSVIARSGKAQKEYKAQVESSAAALKHKGKELDTLSSHLVKAGASTNKLMLAEKLSGKTYLDTIALRDKYMVSVDKLANAQKHYMDLHKPYKKDIEAIEKAYVALQEAATSVDKSYGDFADNLYILDSAMRSIGESSKPVQKMLEDMHMSLEDWNRELANNESKQQALQKALDSMNSSSEVYVAKLKELMYLQHEHETLSKRITKETNKEQMAQDKLAKTLEKVGKEAAKAQGAKVGSTNDPKGVDPAKTMMMLRMMGMGGNLAMITTMFSGISTGALVATAAILKSMDALKKLGDRAVKEAAKVEEFRVKFAGLASVDWYGGTSVTSTRATGAGVLNELINISSDSIYKFDAMAEGVQKLIAYGMDIRLVTSEMKMLGDVALGDSEKLGKLMEVYGRIYTRDPVRDRELRSMVTAGIPIYELLAESMGKTRVEITAMIKEGLIGFEQVNTALRQATSEGGRYYNLAKDLGELSFNGQLNKLMNNINIMLNNLGAKVLPTLGSIVSNLSEAMRISNANKVVRDIDKLFTSGTVERLGAKKALMGVDNATLDNYIQQGKARINWARLENQGIPNQLYNTVSMEGYKVPKADLYKEGLKGIIPILGELEKLGKSNKGRSFANIARITTGTAGYIEQTQELLRTDSLLKGLEAELRKAGASDAEVSNFKNNIVGALSKSVTIDARALQRAGGDASRDADEFRYISNYDKLYKAYNLALHRTSVTYGGVSDIAREEYFIRQAEEELARRGKPEFTFDNAEATAEGKSLKDRSYLLKEYIEGKRVELLTLKELNPYYEEFNIIQDKYIQDMKTINDIDPDYEAPVSAEQIEQWKVQAEASYKTAAAFSKVKESYAAYVNYFNEQTISDEIIVTLENEISLMEEKNEKYSQHAALLELIKVQTEQGVDASSLLSGLDKVRKIADPKVTHGMKEVINSVEKIKAVFGERFYLSASLQKALTEIAEVSDTHYDAVTALYLEIEASKTLTEQYSELYGAKKLAEASFDADNIVESNRRIAETFGADFGKDFIESLEATFGGQALEVLGIYKEATAVEKLSDEYKKLYSMKKAAQVVGDSKAEAEINKKIGKVTLDRGSELFDNTSLFQYAWDKGLGEKYVSYNEKSYQAKLKKEEDKKLGLHMDKASVGFKLEKTRDDITDAFALGEVSDVTALLAEEAALIASSEALDIQIDKQATKIEKLKNTYDGLKDSSALVAKATEQVSKALENAAFQGTIDMFMAFGATIADTEKGVQAMEDAWVNMAKSVLNQLPSILLQAALAAFMLPPIGSGFYLGMGLLAAAGVSGVAAGYANAKTEKEKDKTKDEQAIIKNLQDQLARMMLQFQNMMLYLEVARSQFISDAQIAGLQGYADGDSFGGTGLAHGIYKRPTFFNAYADGSVFNSVMAEAGPEAVLPLRRSASGKLGVIANNTGSDVALVINIENTSGADISTTNVEKTDQGLEIGLLVQDAVIGALSSGKADGVMQARYNIRRQGAY